MRTSISGNDEEVSHEWWRYTISWQDREKR
jgi:hypothetical protein